MTLIELKKSLHEQIDSSNNPQVLEKLAEILKEEKVFIIPDHMMEGILQGEKDIRNGDFITMEELEKRYEKWLKK
jgi:predicted transcriptional regulator